MKKYIKKGKAYLLKEPIDLGSGVSILGLSRDGNGNSLLRIEGPSGKVKSIQYKMDGMNTIDIDELAEGHFVERRPGDVDQIVKWGINASKQNKAKKTVFANITVASKY